MFGNDIIMHYDNPQHRKHLHDIDKGEASMKVKTAKQKSRVSSYSRLYQSFFHCTAFAYFDTQCTLNDCITFVHMIYDIEITCTATTSKIAGILVTG